MLENLEEKNPPDDDDASEKIAEIKPSDALEGVVVSENATSGDGLLRDEKPPRKVSQSSTISAYDRMLSQLWDVYSTMILTCLHLNWIYLLKLLLEWILLVNLQL